MPDQSAITCLDLTKKQYLFLARKLGCFSKRTLLDVSEQGDWISEVIRRNGAIQAIVDHSEQDPVEAISVGSPAGSIKTDAQSVQRVLIRNPGVFQNGETTPESTIALANLLSCLKPRGRMVIPVEGDFAEAQRLWEDRLSGLPGKLTQRVYKTGLFNYLSLTFLLRGIHQIPVLEFTVDRKPISRLEWHRLAREAVMHRMQSKSAA